MKSAEVYTQRARTARGFVWKWRSLDYRKSSVLAFVSYQDCVVDARKAGFTVVALRAEAR